ncbi:MAG TPA: AMP-dependent synthetase [Clostridiales bacterium]|nr:AMP-dependent synthetase [Clostridiales bacterium]
MKNVPLYEVRKISDLRDMIKQSADIYGDKAAFMVKDPRPARQTVSSEAESEGPAEKSQPYLPVSYRQFDRDVDAFGTRLKSLGLTSARVAILAETRYEWYVTYLATVNGVGVVVPLDKELPQVEIESLLNRSYSDILVFSKSKKKDVDAIRQNIPTVKHFICMDEVAGEPDYFWNWLAAGEQALAAGDKSFTEAAIDPEILSILLFTSGTTAKSKAVMLSHRNICINLQAMCSMLYIGPDDVFLSVLPLHHTYECTCGFLCPIYRGCTVAVCEGLRHITKNMQESHCTMILVVPLMVELFYKRIIKAATADPKLAKKFKMGLKISNTLRKIGIDKRRDLFHKIHQNFGGKLRLIIAGGAAIDPKIIKGMQDLGLHTVQGYGLTECAPILALNRDVIYNNRAAGLPLPGVEIRIIDKDENGIGEIIGRGPNVMLGYYENEEATREAIDDEVFFHTGDLGYLDKDNFVIITGRKKNVIITKNGKNIFPEEIEFLLARTGYVMESLVTGLVDAEGETSVAAEIFPNMELIQEQTGETDPKSETVRRLITDVVRKVNHSLAHYKYIKSFTVRDTEFEKTTSKKIKRKY